MVDIRDNLFGTLAVRAQFVLPEQVEETLNLQKQYEQTGQRVPRLGELLAAKGYMTPEQVRAVLQGQGAKGKGLFGEVAVRWHFCSAEDVEAALKLQREMREQRERPQRLGEILVIRGAMKPHQVRAVLQAQGKTIVQCPSCNSRYNAMNIQPGMELTCPRCKALFIPVASEGQERPVLVHDNGNGNAEPAPRVSRSEDVGADVTVQVQAIQAPKDHGSGFPSMEVGPYKLSSRLGTDHTGILYKGLHPQTGNTVALRLFSAQAMQGAEDFDRWIAAGQAASELNHPNLQRIISMGSESGRAFLVMEYIDGSSLRQRLEKKTSIPQLEAIDIMIQCGEALAYGHSHGLIHGDLRPSHILVGGDGRIRVWGLGTPKRVLQDLRLMAARSGSTSIPLYTPPEVIIEEESADERSDVYNLAAIGYHMLTGRPPQEGSDLIQAGLRVAAQDILAPHVIDPKIPPYLDRLLLKGLQPEPDERYDSMTAFLSDLRKCRAGILIQAQDLPEIAAEIGVAKKSIRTQRRKTGTKGTRRPRTYRVRGGSGLYTPRGTKAITRPRSGLNPAVQASPSSASLQATVAPSVSAVSNKRVATSYAVPAPSVAYMAPANFTATNPAVSDAEVLSPQDAVRSIQDGSAFNNEVGVVEPTAPASSYEIPAVSDDSTAPPAAIIPKELPQVSTGRKGHVQDIKPVQAKPDELEQIKEGDSVDLTPTGLRPLKPFQGTTRKRVPTPSIKAGKGVSPLTFSLMVLGGLIFVGGALFFLQREREPYKEPETNVPAVVAEKVVSPEEQAFAHKVRNAEYNFKHDIERFIEQNPEDFEGIVKRLDNFLIAHGTLEPAPDSVQSARKLRDKYASDGAQKTLVELKKKLNELVAQDRFSQANAEIASWRRIWGELAADKLAEEQRQSVVTREKTRLENLLSQARGLRDRKIWNQAREIYQNIMDNFSSTHLDLASRLFKESVKEEEDLKISARVDSVKTMEAEQMQARETNAPRNYRNLLSEIVRPLASLNIEHADLLIESATPQLVGTKMGPDLASLKEEIDLLRGLKRRIAEGARSGKLNNAPLQFQGQNARIVDVGKTGPVLDVGGGKTEIGWDTLGTKELLPLARVATSETDPVELYALGVFQSFNGLNREAVNTLTKASDLGANVSTTLARVRGDNRFADLPKDEKPAIDPKVQDTASQLALKAMGWEISQGLWKVTNGKSFFGIGKTDSEYPTLMSLKRTVPSIRSLSVKIRGKGSQAGISFGNGMRFSLAPSTTWKELSIEVLEDDMIQMKVNGIQAKSLDDASQARGRALPSTVFLRAVGQEIEFLDFTINGSGTLPPKTVLDEESVIARPSPDMQRPIVLADAPPRQKAEAAATLETQGWAIENGLWDYNGGVFRSWMDQRTDLAILRRTFEKAEKIHIELRGSGDTAGISFGTGKRFLIRPGDQWQKLTVETNGSGQPLFWVDGKQRESLEDTRTARGNALGENLMLHASGGTIEFRNFKLE